MANSTPPILEIIEGIKTLEAQKSFFQRKEIQELKIKDRIPDINRWIKQLKDQEKHSSQKFTLLLLGEYNAGKSTVLNAIFDLPKAQRLIASDDPTTALPTRLTYRNEEDPECQWIFEDGHVENKTWEETKAETVQKTRSRKDIIEIKIFLQHNFLAQVDILDMPGTGAAWHPDHERITRDYISNAEAVIWVVGSEEPSSEGIKDINIAVTKDINIYVIFNAWGSENEELDKQMRVDQDSIEDSAKKRCKKAFKYHEGFRIYAKKYIEALDSEKSDADYGLMALKKFFVSEILDSYPDKARERRNNVKRQVQKIAEHIVDEFKKESDLWNARFNNLDSIRENFKTKLRRINVLEHSIRADLRRLAYDRTDSIFSKISKQVTVFINDKIQITNIDIYRNITSKAKMEAYMVKELENYLHLNSPDGWLQKELKDFIEECWTVLEAKWRAFIDEISIESPEISHDQKIDLPFDQLRRAAMQGIGVMITKIMAAGVIIGILLWIPGGQIADAIAISIYLLAAAFTDPMAKARDNAIRRFKNELAMQHSGFKSELVEIAMKGPHKDIKDSFDKNTKTESDKLEGSASILQEGINSISQTIARFEEMTIN